MFIFHDFPPKQGRWGWKGKELWAGWLCQRVLTAPCARAGLAAGADLWGSCRAALIRGGQAGFGTWDSTGTPPCGSEGRGQAGRFLGESGVQNKTGVRQHRQLWGCANTSWVLRQQFLTRRDWQLFLCQCQTSFSLLPFLQFPC